MGDPATKKDIRWAFMRWTDIPDRTNPDQIYLRRLRVVQTPAFAVYLHFIKLPDDDRDPHDHPWGFASFIVRGGYTEKLFAKNGNSTVTYLGEKTHKRGKLHVVGLRKAHRITNVEPGLTTLVFCGRRKIEWGFWTPDGFVRWQDYDRAAGVNPPIDEFA